MNVKGLAYAAAAMATAAGLWFALGNSDDVTQAGAQAELSVSHQTIEASTSAVTPIAVVFGDVAVRQRVVSEPRGPSRVIPQPPASLKSLPNLMSAVERGEPQSIFQLSSLSLRCDILEEAVDRGELPAGNDQALARDLLTCQAIPKKYRQEPLEALMSAADAGVLEAQLAYPGLASRQLAIEDVVRDPDAARQFKTKAMHYLRKAASRGSVEALTELAYAYEQGIFVKGDAITAYAYMEAVRRTGMVPSSGKVLSLWKGNLTGRQLADANALADQIYKGCCQ